MPGNVAVMCMPERGHVQVLLPVVAALSARGAEVRVWTSSAFAGDVARAGASFVDLFTGRRVDDDSLPVASRYVSFAGLHADAVAAEVAAFAASVVIYETFSVVAVPVARRLGIPYVNVYPAHAPVPARALAELRGNPRVATSPSCWRAVERLRSLGMPAAHPHAYLDALSPFLNLYAEPPQFLDEDDRAALAPLAFFGALGEAPPPPRPRRGVYVCFGTVVWRALREPARAAFTALSAAFAALGIPATISLGDAAAELPGAAGYLDQRQALAGAEAFVTHHGLSSTHEAIAAEVPMLSYPFFGDQPRLARRCQALGLALPLSGAPRAPITREAVAGAWQRLHDDRAGFAARLAEAHAWEVETAAGRPAIIERILALRCSR